MESQILTKNVQIWKKTEQGAIIIKIWGKKVKSNKVHVYYIFRNIENQLVFGWDR